MRQKNKTFFYNGKEHKVSLLTLKVFRKVVGKSQKDIGLETGLTREAVSNYENGTTFRNFELEKWYISHGLLSFNVDFSALFKGVDENGIYS